MALNTMDVTKTQKNPGVVYVGLAVPAADAELTISAAGIPDATENPNAKLMGLTDKGSRCKITKTETEEFFDEYEHSLERNVEQVGMSISCNVTQILDIDVVTALTNGVGTPQTVVGKKKVKIGKGTIADTGIAVIAPTKADSTKFLVFHIYKGHNVSEIDFPVGKTERASTPVEFVGVGIASRAKEDRMGAWWWTV